MKFENSILPSTSATVESSYLTTIDSKPNFPYVSSETDPLAIPNANQKSPFMFVLPSMLTLGYVRCPNNTSLNTNPGIPLRFVVRPNEVNNSLNVTPAIGQTKPPNILATQILPSINLGTNSGTTLNSIINNNICTIPTLNSNGLVMCSLTNSNTSTSATQKTVTFSSHQNPLVTTNTGNTVFSQGFVTSPQISSQLFTSTSTFNSKKPPEYKNPFNYSAYQTISSVRDHETIVSTKTNEKSESASKSSEWTCMICSEVQDNKECLLAHYEFHKEEKDKLSAQDGNTYFFECPACFKQFKSDQTYNRHVQKVHEGKEFFCSTCNKNYHDAYTLSKHDSENHSPGSDDYNCCICKSFPTKFLPRLRRHIELKHPKIYKCDICHKSFTSLIFLDNHKIFHIDAAGYECQICRKKFKHSKSLVSHNKKCHIETSKMMKFECEICNLHFANKRTFLRHTSGHAMESSLCFICGKVFGNAEKLKPHLKLHTESNKYVCNVCGRSFSRSNTLVTHLRTHSGEKPYKCTTCGKCFSQRTPLVVHQRHHTGEKPYVCPTCNKGYVSKSTLCIHRKTCK